MTYCIKRTIRPRSSALLVIGALLLMAMAVHASGSRVPLRPQGPGLFNHPVGVAPSSAIHVPPGWPLAPDGTLTCTTCHERFPAGTQQNPPKLRDFAGDLEEVPSFCARCHEAGGHSNRMHWRAITSAHIRPDFETRVSAGAGSIDADSLSCLSCHDGVSAPESFNGNIMGMDFSSFAERGRNHPVGLAYPNLGRRTSDVPIRPQGLLPPEILLPNGRVSCISCHNVFAEGPYRLTYPIEGSALCMTCHQMD